MSNHARIRDYSDREILGIMGDLNGNGVVYAGDIALRITGLKPSNSNLEELDHAARCVTSRLAWMRRFGLVEKGEKPGEWIVSGVGHRLRAAKISNSISQAITATPNDTLLELSHQVGRRMLGQDMIYARVMRRELQFQIGRRRWK